VGAGVGAAPGLQSANTSGQALDERVVDPLLDEHAGCCRAGLSLVEVATLQGVANDTVDVSVVEHDVGVLAAELEEHRGDVCGSGLPNRGARLG
jgi:hypothetical protein